MTEIPRFFPLAEFAVSDVTRFSVSLEADLLERFDRYVAEGKFATRSEAVRQLVHQRLASDQWDGNDREMTATLTLVYDHHKPKLVEKLIEMQHNHTNHVVASLHVHLDHDHCMEVIVLRGKPSNLRALAAELRGLKGVHSGELTLAGTTGGHGHHHAH
jgi:CopG family transcriptional regulator, nickel-responsive regulator